METTTTQRSGDTPNDFTLYWLPVMGRPMTAGDVAKVLQEAGQNVATAHS